MNIDLISNVYFCIAYAEKKGEINFQQAQDTLNTMHFPPFTNIDEMETTKDWKALAEIKMKELIENIGSLNVKVHKENLPNIQLKLLLTYKEELEKWCQK